jgi:hypothetical protein
MSSPSIIFPGAFEIGVAVLCRSKIVLAGSFLTLKSKPSLRVQISSGSVATYDLRFLSVCWPQKLATGELKSTSDTFMKMGSVFVRIERQRFIGISEHIVIGREAHALQQLQLII